MTVPTANLPSYNISESYEWNYRNAPNPVEIEVSKPSGQWDFLGFPTESPLGVPAGPLLNGKWVLYYASLGFDVLTYKTVRSVEHPCYSLPNLQPVETGPLRGGEEELPAIEKMKGSWAVSFGMPSQRPDVWRRDIEWTRGQLPRGKVLSVSVVGTIQEGWGLEELAQDYARCAKWAVESGADTIETNFSCPNVATPDGQLYQEHDSAGRVAGAVREAIGKVPYIVKVGHVRGPEEAESLLESLNGTVDALAMTNSVATRVRDSEGNLLFGGERRGICGKATLEESLRQTERFHDLIRQKESGVKLIGVGGVSTLEDVRSYLRHGAHAVHLATAAMVDPTVALRIRRELDSED